MQILFSHFFVIYMICQFFIPLQMVSLKNNQIYKLQIIQSSGYKILDAAALRAVEKSKICLQNVFDTYFNKIIFEYAFIMPYV